MIKIKKYYAHYNHEDGMYYVDKSYDYIKQGRNLSSEELHKLAYTIAYNQLSERDDTKAMASFVDSFIERTKNLKNP